MDYLELVYGVDVHGDQSSFRKLITVFKDVNADLMILGGDLNVDLQLLAELRDKVMVVPGECDDIYVTKRARELGILFDGVVASVNECRIGFLGGLSAHQSIRRLYDGNQGPLDFLVTHFPPKGCLDLILGKHHGGLKELNALITKYQVKYVLTGHYHGNVGSCTLADAVVLNPGPLNQGNYLIMRCSRRGAEYKFMKLP